MTILNCTLKLSNRMPFPVSEESVQARNTLGAWSGNVFNIGRFPHIIVTNELTLLSVVISLKDVHTFWKRFLISLERLLSQLGLPEGEIQEELRSMAKVSFSRRTNRRTLGSMTDLVHMVRAVVDDKPDSTLDEINQLLSKVPSLTMQGLYPRDALHKAFHRLAPDWNDRIHG